MPWAVAIFGAALIGVAVHGLTERGEGMDDDLNRQAKQRQAAVVAAKEILGDVTVAELIALAEYIRSGTLPSEEP
jgi:hypothetical protein